MADKTFTVNWPHDGRDWAQLHRPGCTDLKRGDGSQDDIIQSDGMSDEELALNVIRSAGEFDEPEQATDWVRWMPCTKGMK